MSLASNLSDHNFCKICAQTSPSASGRALLAIEDYRARSKARDQFQRERLTAVRQS